MQVSIWWRHLSPKAKTLILSVATCLSLSAGAITNYEKIQSFFIKPSVNNIHTTLLELSCESWIPHFGDEGYLLFGEFGLNIYNGTSEKISIHSIQLEIQKRPLKHENPAYLDAKESWGGSYQGNIYRHILIKDHIRLYELLAEYPLIDEKGVLEYYAGGNRRSHEKIMKYGPRGEYIEDIPAVMRDMTRTSLEVSPKDYNYIFFTLDMSECRKLNMEYVATIRIEGFMQGRKFDIPVKNIEPSRLLRDFYDVHGSGNPDHNSNGIPDRYDDAYNIKTSFSSEEGEIKLLAFYGSNRMKNAVKAYKDKYPDVYK